MGLLTDFMGGGLVKQAGKAISKRKKKSSDPQNSMDRSPVADPDSYAHGGVVKRSGWAKVHKGERVLTRKQRRKSRSK